MQYLWAIIILLFYAFMIFYTSLAVSSLYNKYDKNLLKALDNFFEDYEALVITWVISLIITVVASFAYFCATRG